MGGGGGGSEEDHHDSVDDGRAARREPRTGVEELPFRPGAGISAHDPEAAPPLGRTRHPGQMLLTQLSSRAAEGEPSRLLDSRDRESVSIGARASLPGSGQILGQFLA